MLKKVLLLLLVLSFQAFGSYSEFEKRFQFVREDGKLIAVRDRSLTPSFKIRDYLEYIKNSIMHEQAMINAESGLYADDIRSILAESSNEFASERNEDNEYVVKSMLALGKVDFTKVFSNPAFNEVMTKFESKLREIFFYVDPLLVAKPDNAKFFYKRNATYQAVSFALNLAKKKLSTVPVLNTAIYAIKEIEKMITKRRTYHQNLLLHYLENVSESELGLSKEEADSIFSSIYESRIAWFAFWESNKAKLNWSRYGSSMFYQNFRVGTSKIRQFQSSYDDIEKRLNYAFQEVTYKGERVIVNLLDSSNMFDSKPAVAFSFDNPGKIKRLRAILTLGGLGLSFVPLPAFIKDIVSDYMKSWYEKQQITEGALFAHFEIMGEQDALRRLRSQYINPFDMKL